MGTSLLQRIVQEERKISPITKAYLFSSAAFLIPSWIASALTESVKDTDFSDPIFVVIIVLFALTCWSPSVGLFLFKKKWYALLSGAGRLLIIIFAVLADRAMLKDIPPGEGHAYATVLGIMAAMTWGIIDYVLIYIFGKKQQSATTPSH